MRTKKYIHIRESNGQVLGRRSSTRIPTKNAGCKFIEISEDLYKSEYELVVVGDIVQVNPIKKQEKDSFDVKLKEIDDKIRDGINIPKKDELWWIQNRSI